MSDRATRVRVDWFVVWMFLLTLWIAIVAKQLDRIADHLTHDCPICEPLEKP